MEEISSGHIPYPDSARFLRRCLIERKSCFCYTHMIRPFKTFSSKHSQETSNVLFNKVYVNIRKLQSVPKKNWQISSCFCNNEWKKRNLKTINLRSRIFFVCCHFTFICIICTFEWVNTKFHKLQYKGTGWTDVSYRKDSMPAIT